MSDVVRTDIDRVTLAMLTVDPGGMGGGETYARALTRTLTGVEGMRVRALVPRTARGFSEGVDEVVARGVTSGAGHRRRGLGMLRAAVHTPWLRRRLGEGEVLFFPFTVPLPYPGRRQGFVQMVFDLQHLDLPELFPRSEHLFRRFAYEATARRADAVITISEFSKQRIVELLGVPEERVHVAYLGVDTERFRPGPEVREDFVYYPARAWPHKNHARLIEAVRSLRAGPRPGLRLVLTGGDLAKLGPLPDFVEWRGHLSVDGVADLYRRASALAFPSLYEGFGFPAVEAMASGCPVAASTAGSLPEICGEAAEYMDPLDVGSIARAIDTAITRGDELRDLGLRRAQRFRWETCRDEHVEVFRQVSRELRSRSRR